MILKRDIHYIRIKIDKIEIRNLRRSKSIMSVPKLKYHNDRLLIANFFNAESEIRKCLEELNGKPLFSRPTTIIFQPLHPSISNYSQVELASFRDICAHSGASKVFLYLEKDYLQDETIMKNIKSKNSIFLT